MVLLVILETTITSKDDNYTLNVQSAAGTGLRIRKSQTPFAFINGVRYPVDAITNMTAAQVLQNY